MLPYNDLSLLKAPDFRKPHSIISIDDFVSLSTILFMTVSPKQSHLYSHRLEVYNLIYLYDSI